MLLDQPLEIGKLAVKNRVKFGSHQTNLSKMRTPEEAWIAYYRSRIEGGVGIVVTEEASVDESDWPYERSPLAKNCAPAWSSLARIAKANDCLLLIGIGHSGAEGSSAFSQLPMLAPSPIPDVASREVPKSLEEYEAQDILAAFESATQWAMDAGADGVELNLAYRSLIRSFLSPLTNQRPDRYGIDRTLFAFEVINRVRSGLKGGRLALRVSLDELAPWGGLGPDDLIPMVVELAAQCDLVTVGVGSGFTRSAFRPDFHLREAFNNGLSKRLKKAAAGQFATFLQGSITQIAVAESLCLDGDADGVEMTRALVADPNLVKKLRSNEVPISCSLCNQGCLVEESSNPVISCQLNPDSGHELDPTPKGFFEIRQRPRRPSENSVISIVGSGPAGLELASSLADAGFEIELFERDQRLGGNLRRISDGGVGGVWSRPLSYYLSRIENSRIKAYTNREVTPGEISHFAKRGPLFLATGSIGSARYSKVFGYRHWISTSDLLSGQLPPHQKRVYVLDNKGDHESAWAAETATGFADEVIVVTEDPSPYSRLHRTGDLMSAISRARALGIKFKTFTEMVAKDEAIEISNRFSPEKERITGCLVIEVGARESRRLIEITEKGTQGITQGIFEIGDCFAPRTIQDAIREARCYSRALVEMVAT